MLRSEYVVERRVRLGSLRGELSPRRSGSAVITVAVCACEQSPFHVPIMSIADSLPKAEASKIYFGNLLHLWLNGFFSFFFVFSFAALDFVQSDSDVGYWSDSFIFGSMCRAPL